MKVTHHLSTVVVVLALAAPVLGQRLESQAIQTARPTSGDFELLAAQPEIDGSPIDVFIWSVDERRGVTTLAARGLDAESLQTIIFNGSNLQVRPDVDVVPLLTFQAPGLYTFDVPTQVAGAVHKVRFVFTNGAISERLLDFEGLESFQATKHGQHKDAIRAWLVKTAVRLLAKGLRSHALQRILAKAEEFGGKQVANTIRRYGPRIADTLDWLATWEDLVPQAVHDQVRNMLRGLRVPYPVAEQTGLVIKHLLDWALKVL